MMADVLVVDDNLLMQQVISRFLGSLGYTVQVVSRGDEALTQVRSAVPTLILLDMYLPDGNGVELLRAIRALPGCATVPAVGMSGMDEHDARQMLSADFSEFVSKPIDLDTLETLVRRYIGPPLARKANENV